MIIFGTDRRVRPQYSEKVTVTVLYIRNKINKMKKKNNEKKKKIVLYIHDQINELHFIPYYIARTMCTVQYVQCETMQYVQSETMQYVQCETMQLYVPLINKKIKFTYSRRHDFNLCWYKQ